MTSRRHRWGIPNLLIWLTLSLCLSASTVYGVTDTIRVPALLLHRSVGHGAVSGCFSPDRPIWPVFDTLDVTHGNMFGQLRFRGYDIDEEASDSALSDTTNTGSCATDRVNDLDYGWDGHDKTYYNNTCPLLKSLLDGTPSDSAWWVVFTEHDSMGYTEEYQIIGWTPPYDQWWEFDSLRMDSLKTWYPQIAEALHDIDDQKIFILFTGTPLAYDGGGVSGEDADADSAAQRIAYEAVRWLVDSMATYSNVFVMDTYRMLCDLTASANLYSLDSGYWAGDGNESHLNATGYELLQDSLISFYQRAAEKWLVLNYSGYVYPRQTCQYADNWHDDQVDSGGRRYRGAPHVNFEADRARWKNVWGLDKMIGEYYSWTDIDTIVESGRTRRDFIIDSVVTWGGKAEDWRYHFAEACSVTIGGSTIYRVGINNATTLADTVNSAANVFSTTRYYVRHSDSLIMRADMMYARYFLFGDSIAGCNDAQDYGMFDNVIPRIYNQGTLAWGSDDIDEVYDSGYFNLWFRENYHYDSCLKPSLQMFADSMSVGAWDGDTKEIYGNVASYAFPYLVDMAELGLLDYFGIEFYPRPYENRLVTLLALREFDSVCDVNGVNMMWVTYFRTDYTHMTHAEWLYAALALYYVWRTPTTIHYNMGAGWAGVGYDSAGGQGNDTLIYEVGLYDEYVGEFVEAPDTVFQTGTDGASQSYKITGRKYCRAITNDTFLTLHHPKLLSADTTGPTTAVSVALGGSYQKLNADGSFAAASSTASIEKTHGWIGKQESAGGSAPKRLKGINP